MHETPEVDTYSSPQQSPITPTLPEGYLLRNYRIIKKLGRGGFGITYLAHEESTDRPFVIKENYPTDVSFRDMTSLTVGPSGESQKDAYNWALKRFRDEVKILSGLNHPNIVPIHDDFEALGTAYYVMPHVEGTELHKAAPAPDIITAEWLQPVLEKILYALDYIHSQKLIHRDIKPNNILLRADDEPVLIDFGTARTLESTHSHTHIGTPGFMPLEQFSSRGKRGPWTDFYALGATIYRLITGDIPPSSTDRVEEDEYRPLVNRVSLTERFPEHFLSSIDKALLMNRKERWQTAQEWLEALNTKPKVIRTSIETEPQIAPEKQVHSEIIKTPLPCTQAQEELTNLGITTDIYNDTLLSATKRGDAPLITLLIAAGADVNKANLYRETPLFWAAFNGHTECIKVLLSAPNIDVNKADNGGWSPLSWAANQGHAECVKLFIAAPGINVNKTTHGGATPLSCAAYHGHEECIEILLTARGIDINKADDDGWTPLSWAACKGHTKCVRLLLASPEINVNIEDDDGWTPLGRATFKGHIECARLIREAGGM